MTNDTSPSAEEPTPSTDDTSPDEPSSTDESPTEADGRTEAPDAWPESAPIEDTDAAATTVAANVGRSAGRTRAVSLGIAAAIALGGFGAGYAVDHARSDNLTGLPAAFVQRHGDAYGSRGWRGGSDEMQPRPGHWGQR